MWHKTVLSHTLFDKQNMIKSKYQGQFSCYPKEIHTPGWYPFPALKCNQPGFIMISDPKLLIHNQHENVLSHNKNL